MLVSLCFLQKPLSAQLTGFSATVTNQQDSVLSGEALIFSEQDYALIQSLNFNKGELKADGLNKGRFLLKIMSLSYRDTTIQINLNGNFFQLGRLRLQTSNLLSEVVISTQLPTFQNTKDGTRLNVENTLLAASASSGELLSKFPALNVSGNKVSVFGRGEALIYLGGKQIPYELFMSIPVNRIKSVELINNPSAKYDARGRSVLLVTLKKNEEEGLQGLVSENATWGRHFINAGNLNLNYRKNKLSLSSDYGLSLGTDWNTNTYTMRFDLPSGIYTTNGYYQEDTRLTNVSNYRFGAAYDINKKSNLSAQYDGLYNTYSLDVQTRSNYYNPDQQMTAIYMRNNGFTKNLNHSANMNYNLNLDTLGSSLFAGLQYNNFETQLYDQIKENIRPYSGKTVNGQRVNDGKNNIGIYTFQVDYQRVFKNTARLESGLKYSDVSNKGKVAIKTKFDSSDVWIDYSQYANNFVYNEKVPAIYINYSGSRKKAEYVIGLRSEFSDIKGYSNKLKKYIIDTTYLNVFPSGKLTYNFNRKWAASGSYALKINRPLYQDIDPFVWYLDSLTSITGNSKLIPELNNQTEASLNYNNFGLRIGYTHTRNAIRSIVRPGNTGINSVLYIKENIQQFTQWNFSLDIPFEKKSFSTYNTLALNINQLQDQRPEFVSGKLTPQFYLYTMNQFKVKNWFSLQLNGEFYSYNSDGLSHRQPIYYLSGGLSRYFFNKKLFCQLTYNDFLKSYRFAGDRRIGTVTTIYNQHINSSYFRVFLSYKFGALKKTNYANKTINDSEFNRLKI
ncbi:MAG: TonB-dependent receptor family protein [Bacteroidia bacterium]|nr:TonB-dependent receptor family protein [Bacteroidia bacterium]